MLTEKRNKITVVSIDEFAKYGYKNSSTNRIVQNAGISKGSLFKYFKNKDELYFYILDSVTQELIYGLKGQSIYYKLLYDVDTSVLRFDKKKSIDVLKWFLTGFNKDFLSHIQIQDNVNIDNI